MPARLLACIASALIAIVTATEACAAWPERAVTLVVPFAAGGITDTLARITAAYLQTALGQPFVVENQSGAAGAIATEHVARAEPDGYTLLFSTLTQIAVVPMTNKVAYDPINDFKPVSIIATSPFVLTTDADFPAKTVSEFITYVKAHPAQLTYGTAGAGSLSHISAAVFLKRAGLDMTMVPYRGLVLAFDDLLSGNVQMVSATSVELRPFMNTGKVRLLASSGAARSPGLPDVPAIAETFPGHEVVTWNGVHAPARTPQAVIDTLARAILAAENDKDFTARLQQIGVDPVTITPADFQARIVSETEYWRKLVSEMGLQAQ
ncbi:MAG TPA: tripartite tricarboxylate transporter substrate binding protein [Xanthobacteraceae bacterium]|jgi:tripartite-type tricarboxylate transporter receptor subunit TctC|nr:tripartite tricarboxylate transporter substrate binding protein [Xanthobacteraceae bacterium]